MRKQHIRILMQDPDNLETAIFDDTGRRYCPVHDVAEIDHDVFTLFQNIDFIKLATPEPSPSSEAV